MRQTIALYGKSGAGKTAIAKYLVDKYGFVRCSTGQACRQVCRLLFDSESKTILNKVTDALKTVDEDVWLRAALREYGPETPIVFDSMRFANDYHFLDARGFSKWKVVAPLALRVERLRQRGQEFDPEVDDDHPGENILSDYIFDITIENSSVELATLYREIEKNLG